MEEKLSRIELKNDQLTISILEPGKEYTRSRFDWSGIVEQVTLNGTTFLGQEAQGDNRGTEGVGLSNEFGIETAIGYDEVKVGEEFLKIGIGAQIREEEKDYFFFDEYRNRTFPIEYKVESDRVDFQQNGVRLNGYGYDYSKSIILYGNSLTIHCKLKNIGDKPIVTEEYCHNFFRLADSDITKDTVIQLNYEFGEIKKVGDINKFPSMVNFNNDLVETFYVKGEVFGHPDDFSWRLSNKVLGVAVECYEDFKQSIFACWGMPYVISPETFKNINLKPNEETTWNRTYKFFKE